MFRELPPDVAALLARQHGVATTRQLHDAGLTQRRCTLAVQLGLLMRPRRDVYVDRAIWRTASKVTRHAMRLLAVQLVASDAVGVGTTAAMAWQLPVSRPPSQPEVGRTRDRGRLAGAVVRRIELRPEDLEDVEGLTVSSLPATCASIAASAELPEALITLDAALRRGTPVDDVLAAAERLARATHCHRAKHVIGWADPWSESWLESLSRGRMIEAELPTPQCNVTLIAGRREARVDKLWAEACVIGEADGKGKYQHVADVAEAHWREKQRREWLEDLGFEVARWVPARWAATEPSWSSASSARS